MAGSQDYLEPTSFSNSLSRISSLVVNTQLKERDREREREGEREENLKGHNFHRQFQITGVGPTTSVAYYIIFSSQLFNVPGEVAPSPISLQLQNRFSQ